MMARSPHGFALLIVLWSAVLLALLATGLTAAGRSELQLAGNVRRAAAAEAAADGGIAAAEFHVADLPSWPADGQLHQLRIGGYAVTVRVMDENGKINPNFAEPEVLAALLVATGSDPVRAAALAQAIVDWGGHGPRDPVIQRYRSAGMAAAPTGAPFRSVAELGLVIGMTPGLLARIAPHLSVFATGDLDRTHADPVVTAALRSLNDVPPQEPAPAVVFDITADASAPDGSRFVRHAIVARGRQTDARPFKTLLWETIHQAEI